ncbi:hypothetical protein AAFF_G00430230 [Aldrovandia affinis]|uniref:Uncharacterized protein n=1 Tax=Aldrovandia affinis TaxID=143900 RepID=A0AAD7S918_9TELE|nr:hypothetical protein AAFF_G00430230 [Aldrovandia affinis]
MMSTAAVANGDGVADRSLVAVLHSTGNSPDPFLFRVQFHVFEFGIFVCFCHSFPSSGCWDVCRRGNRHCWGGICSGLGCPGNMGQEMTGHEQKQLVVIKVIYSVLVPGILN